MLALFMQMKSDIFNIFMFFFQRAKEMVMDLLAEKEMEVSCSDITDILLQSSLGAVVAVIT
jgi:hypothetical protein